MLDNSLSRGSKGGISPCCEGHGVHFYADRNELAQRVHAHIAPVLQRGHGAIVVAGPESMLAFERYARNEKLDVQRLTRDRRLMLFDAQWLLDRFMVDGRPDPRRFRAIVGGQLKMLTYRTPGIHVYGEMVTLLMEAGNPDGALELEAMWNVLAGERSFNLLCAYPLDLFTTDRYKRELEKVRQAHNYTLRTLED